MVWIPLILAGANALNQAQGQKKNADAINRAQRRYEKLNFMLANQDAVRSYFAVAARRAQDRTALFNSMEQVTLDATRRIGAASVSSGESGVHGNTSAALINDFKIAQLKSEGNIMDTEKYMQEQYSRDVDAIRAQKESRIRGGEQQRVQGPDYMQIFLNGFTEYMQMQQQFKNANRGPNGEQVGNDNVPQINTPGGGYNALQE